MAVTQPAPPQHKALDRAFDTVIVAKGIFGAIELAAGIAMFFVAPDTVRSWLSWVSAHFHHSARPSHLWHFFEHLADRLDASATGFAAVYLAVHGVVKLIIVVGLLRGRGWAFPLMIWVTVAFILYQVWEMLHHFTWPMVLLTLFDLVVLWLTTSEWRVRRERALAVAV